MAISNTSDALFVQNLLKVSYENDVASLLFRDDPVLNNIVKERVEGKSQHFAAIVGRGGAVAGDFTKATAQASKNMKSAEFQIEPGKVFSVYTISSIEIQAAKTLQGAYMPIAAAKMFAATEAFRKTLAACLYGMGYGEIAYVSLGSGSSWSANDTFQIVIPEDAAMKIDIGSQLLLKAKITSEETDSTQALEVLAIGSLGTYTATGTIKNAGTGILITVKAKLQLSSLAADTTYVLALAGSMNGAEPILPKGLSAWVPYLNGRNLSDAEWAAYAHTSFFGVVRDEAIDRLAGAYVVGTSGETGANKRKTLERLLRRVRQQGGKNDFIVMNDQDWADISETLQTTNAYWTATTGDTAKGKRTLNTGVNDMRINFSTSWIDKVYDSPFCPKGVAYVLDSRDFRFWGYYNDAKIDNGVPGNEPGTPDPTTENPEIQSKPYQLLIDDYITVDGGSDTFDGPNARVTINCAGSFVIKNPAHAGVCVFYGETPIGSQLFA